MKNSTQHNQEQYQSEFPKRIWIRYNKNQDEPDKISNVERHKKAVLKLCTDPPNLLEQYEVTIPRSLQTETSEYKWPKVRKVTSLPNRKKLFCFFYVTNEYRQEVEKCSKCCEDDKYRGICQREDVQRGFLLARCDRVIYNVSKKKSKLPVVFLCRPSDQVHSQELYVDIYFVQVEQPEIVEFHGRAQLTYRKGSNIKKYNELKSPLLFNEINPQLPSSFSTSWNMKQDKGGSRIQETQSQQHRQQQRCFPQNQPQLHGHNFLLGNMSNLSTNNSPLPNTTTLSTQALGSVNTINTFNINAVNYNSTSFTSSSPQFATNSPSTNSSNLISSIPLNSTIPSSIPTPINPLLNLGRGGSIGMSVGTTISPNVLVNPPSISSHSYPHPNPTMTTLGSTSLLNGNGTPTNSPNGIATGITPTNFENTISIIDPITSTHGGNSMSIVAPTPTQENINIQLFDNHQTLWGTNSTITNILPKNLTQQNVNSNLTLQNQMQTSCSCPSSSVCASTFSSVCSSTSSSLSSSPSTSSSSSSALNSAYISSTIPLSFSSPSLDCPIKTENPSNFHSFPISTSMHLDMDADESINAFFNSIYGNKQESMDWVKTPPDSPSLILDEKDKTCFGCADEMFDCMIVNKMTEFSQLQHMYDAYKDHNKKKELQIESLSQMVQKLTQDMNKLTEELTKLKEENRCVKTCLQDSENESWELKTKYETLFKQYSILQQFSQLPQVNDSRRPFKRQLVELHRKAVQAPKITTLEIREDFIARRKTFNQQNISSINYPILTNNSSLMMPINTSLSPNSTSNFISNQTNITIPPLISPTPTKPIQLTHSIQPTQSHSQQQTLQFQQ